jgi:hypothetical protein
MEKLYSSLIPEKAVYLTLDKVGDVSQEIRGRALRINTRNVIQSWSPRIAQARRGSSLLFTLASGRATMKRQAPVAKLSLPRHLEGFNAYDTLHVLSRPVATSPWCSCSRVVPMQQQDNELHLVRGFCGTTITSFTVVQRATARSQTV